jgi:uncharacterized protein
MKSEEFSFQSSDGLTIEAALDQPEEVRGALVFCHPHPQMGGTMNAPLLKAVRDRLVGDGWAVLRFNFRGIGASEGESSTGEEEVADAEGAVAEALERFPDVPLAIAGWSFGAAVAVRTAALRDEIAACIGIAPAVKKKEGITAGLPDPDDIDLKAKLLFVCGANDKHVSPADCRSWIEARGSGDYEEVSGANHFFWAKYDDLSEIVSSWLDENALEEN